MSIGGTGMVRQLTLTDDEVGTTSICCATISSPASGVGTATAVAITTNRGNVYSIDSLRILNPGYGYTQTPTVTISGGNGSGASATATLGNNGISTFTINSEDNEGYYSIPDVTTEEEELVQVQKQLFLQELLLVLEL